MRPPIHLTGVEYFVIAQCCIHSQPSCSLRDLSSLKFEISIQRKFFPYVSKIDNGYGDRNLCCTCRDLE